MTEEQTIDLTSALWTQQNTGIPSDTISDFIIDWGDSKVAFRTNGSDKSLLTHTYAKPNQYVIKLYGTIKWFTACTTANASLTEPQLAKFLTEINVPNKCPIRQLAGDTWHVSSNTDGLGSGFEFFNCQKLIKVTGDLGNGLVESETNKNVYWGLFYRCYELTNVPEFTFPSGATRMSLRGAHNSCNKLKTIPDNVFDSLPKTLTYLKTRDQFCHSVNIDYLPERLFQMLPDSLTELDAHIMFYETKITSIPSNMGNKIPNTDKVDLSGLFMNCTEVTGELPPLWETHPNVIHGGCFCGCTKASNYDQVPDDWKNSISLDSLYPEFPVA